MRGGELPPLGLCIFLNSSEHRYNYLRYVNIEVAGLQRLLKFVNLLFFALPLIEQKVWLNYFVESLVVEDIKAELGICRIARS